MFGPLSRSGVVAVALGLCAWAAPARAETTATSSIAQVMVLEPSDPSYHTFHGAVWLDHDKAQWNYRWGGQACKGRELSDANVQLLFAAFRAEYQVALEYVVTDFKGKPYRCITGMTITKS